MEKVIASILNKKWFYRFKLPDGQVTECYMDDEVVKIHDTRLEMMDSVLTPRFNNHSTPP